MADTPQFVIHKACIDWAEANHADGRLVAIGIPYYLPSSILSALRATGYAVVRDVGDSDGNACLNPYSGDYEAGAEGAYNKGWDDCRDAMFGEPPDA